MAVVQPKSRLFTPEEYLALEREADYKSEYLDGLIYAMAGSSPEHSAITANAVINIGGQLLDRPCQVFSSDMKVRTALRGLYAYPNLSIVCGEPQFHDEKRDVLVNPIVIVEVLSDAMEAYDRGKKFIQYRLLESLKDYVLIAQDAPYVEHYERQTDNEWLLTTASGLEGCLYIASIDCTLSLAGVYRNIRFSTGAAMGEKVE